MTCQYGEGLSGANVPETDGIVAPACAGECATIRRKHNSTDLIGVSHKGRFEMLGDSIPQTDSAVIASDCEGAAVRGVCNPLSRRGPCPEIVKSFCLVRTSHKWTAPASSPLTSVAPSGENAIEWILRLCSVSVAIVSFVSTFHRRRGPVLTSSGKEGAIG